MFQFQLRFCLFVLVNYCIAQKPALTEIEIVTPAYFGSDSLTSTTYLHSAFTTGLKRLRETYPQFYFSHQFLIDGNPTSCLEQQAIVQDSLSRWYYLRSHNTSISVIFTAGCLEAEYINQLARAWNILMLTAIGADDTIRKRSQSPTWITNAPLPTNYGELYTSFLLRNNWTSISVIADLTAPAIYQYMAKLLPLRLKQAGFTLTTRNLLFAGKNKEELNRLLSGLQEFSRVVIYFGGSASLRRLLIAASDKYMTNGDYVFFAAQPFEHSLYGTFHWRSSGNGNGIEDKNEDEKVRSAYRSVILLNEIYEPPDTINRVKKLLPIWQNLSKTDSVNETDLNLPVPFLTATHTFFQVLGQALDTMTQETSSLSELRNGTMLAGHFFNKTFPSDVGPITFNSFGSRLTVASIKQFQNDSGELETFLTSIEDNDGFVTWHSLQPVAWFGGTNFPPNEPLCGFLGQASVCQKKGQSLLIPTTIGFALIMTFCVVISACLIRLHLKNGSILTEWWKLDPFHLESTFTATSTLRLKEEDVMMSITRHFMSRSISSGRDVYRGLKFAKNQKESIGL